MAPESIQYHRYSHKSDVYAFGTLLWEMWSGGAIPFMLVTDEEEVARRVLAGVRPQAPQQCPNRVLKLMESCWREGAAERPTFDRIKMDLQDAYGDEMICEMASQAAQERDEQSLCVVCMESEGDFALLPCGHKCVCEVDAAAMCIQGKCPICWGQVHSFNRIF